MDIEYQPQSSPRPGIPETLRSLRAAAIAALVRLLPPMHRERDSYFADAVDLSDLEQRIRAWERRPSAFRSSK